MDGICKVTVKINIPGSFVTLLCRIDLFPGITVRICSGSSSLVSLDSRL